MNAANKGHVKNQEHRQRRQETVESKDLQTLLRTPEFRRFAWRYLGECRVYKQTFDHSGSVTAFNEGKRSVGLKILAEITAADPDSYLQMMKENKEEGEN